MFMHVKTMTYLVISMGLTLRIFSCNYDQVSDPEKLYCSIS